MAGGRHYWIWLTFSHAVELYVIAAENGIHLWSPAQRLSNDIESSLSDTMYVMEHECLYVIVMRQFWYGLFSSVAEDAAVGNHLSSCPHSLQTNNNVTDEIPVNMTLPWILISSNNNLPVMVFNVASPRWLCLLWCWRHNYVFLFYREIRMRKYGDALIERYRCYSILFFVRTRVV